MSTILNRGTKANVLRILGQRSGRARKRPRVQEGMAAHGMATRSLRRIIGAGGLPPLPRQLGVRLDAARVELRRRRKAERQDRRRARSRR